MGFYELMVLVPSELGDSPKNELIKLLKDDVVSLGGEVVNENSWGKRELAYPIAKKNFADFFYFELSLPPQSVSNLDKKLRMNNSVMRHLLVKIDKKDKVENKVKKAEEGTTTEKAKKVASRKADKVASQSRGKKKVAKEKSKK